jgi:hypothetical protein
LSGDVKKREKFFIRRWKTCIKFNKVVIAMLCYYISVIERTRARGSKLKLSTF